MKSRSVNMYYSEMETPIGPITVAQSRKGLCWIDFNEVGQSVSALERWSRKNFLTTKMQHDDQAMTEIKEQLTRYFNEEICKFECELDIVGTPFQKLVWRSLLNIPYGETRTYKQIAQEIGMPKAVRAVGGANNKNNIPIVIPCHRVIGSNGALVGYGSGLSIKKQLLELEGHKPMNTIKNA